MSGTSPDELDGGDVSGLAGLYALDALDGDELARFESYLARHPEAADEVDEFRRTAARLASMSARPAPADLRDQVLSRLGDVRQEPPSLEAARARRRSSPARRVAAVAASVLVLAGVGIGGYLVGASQDAPRDELALLLDNADATVIALEGSEGSSARLVYSASASSAVVLADGLPPIGEDQVYELWQLQGDVPVPIGLFDPRADGEVSTPFQVDLGAADAVALTIEPAGGSDTPTLPIIAAGELA